MFFADELYVARLLKKGCLPKHVRESKSAVFVIAGADAGIRNTVHGNAKRGNPLSKTDRYGVAVVD